MQKEKNDIDLINKYSRKTLTADDVYIFTVTLCDNEIDRDFDRFSTAALKTLGDLFVGKTGIFDHNPKAGSQTARIFKTWLETDKQRKTSLGEPYCALKAKAYMVKTSENAALIDEIDGGIKKEVSVGCAVEKAICSICGKDIKSGECSHTKGKNYRGKLCHAVLTQPYDAYEWSFVAVPAQRNAGVTKAYTWRNFSDVETVKAMNNPEGTIILDEKQANEICDYIKSLEKEVQWSKQYKTETLAQIKKYAMTVMPRVDIKTFLSICEQMPPTQMNALKESLRLQAMDMYTGKTQLRAAKKQTETNYGEYKI